MKHFKMNNKKQQIPVKDARNKNTDSGNDELLPENDSQEIDAAEETPKSENEVSTLKDMLLRKAAEFENYKKRHDQEISNYIKFASENIIKELLPVYDDLGRSVESIDKGETKDFETLKKGVALIYEKFKKVLESEGLSEINSLGKEFNVDVNSALMQIQRDDVKANTVLNVIEKGYKLKDKVIKHEKVMVSSEPNQN